MLLLLPRNDLTHFSVGYHGKRTHWRGLSWPPNGLRRKVASRVLQLPSALAPVRCPSTKLVASRPTTGCSYSAPTKAKQLGTSHSRPPLALQIVPANSSCSSSRRSSGSREMQNYDNCICSKLNANVMQQSLLPRQHPAWQEVLFAGVLFCSVLFCSVQFCCLLRFASVKVNSKLLLAKLLWRLGSTRAQLRQHPRIYCLWRALCALWMLTGQGSSLCHSHRFSLNLCLSAVASCCCCCSGSCSSSATSSA